MSQENIQTNYLTREDLQQIEKNQQKSAWYAPNTAPERDDFGRYVLPQTIYLGEVSGRPTWEDPVMNAGLAKEAMNAFRSGSLTDTYKVKVDPFIGNWQKVAHQYADLKTAAIKSDSMSNLKSAGIGMAADFSAIDIVNVMNEMINTELRDFTLEQAVTTVATPNLLLKIDSYTRFTGQKSIGEAVQPVTKLGAVTRTSFDLVKDGTAIALSFEAQARSSRDLYRTHVDNAVSDLRRIKAGKIAVELETATDVAAGDWAAITSDHYTRSALDDIGTVSDTIVSNNGRPDTIAVHDRVARDLISNLGASAIAFTGNSQNITGQLGGVLSTARTVQIPGTNYTMYIDNEKTNTIATVYDKSAVIKMQGPVRTATVRDELADVDMFRVFDFNLPKLIIAGRARDLTGVSA